MAVRDLITMVVDRISVLRKKRVRFVSDSVLHANTAQALYKTYTLRIYYDVTTISFPRARARTRVRSFARTHFRV
jgi:hypothetical protein